MASTRFAALGAVLACATLAAPVWARPGPWGPDPWDQSRGPSAWQGRAPAQDRSREGRVSVDRFVADGDAASLLGKGSVAVTSRAPGDEWIGPSDRAAFEAAVIDRLVHAGYRTDAPESEAAQIVELRVARQVLVPAEAKRSPVSGQAAMAMSNRGTAYGLSVAVDTTKPLPALVSTRMDARIRDRASGRILWEGRAEVATRDGSAEWTDAAIASKLSEALFDGFPLTNDGLASRRIGG